MNSEPNYEVKKHTREGKNLQQYMSTHLPSDNCSMQNVFTQLVSFNPYHGKYVGQVLNTNLQKSIILIILKSLIKTNVSLIICLCHGMLQYISTDAPKPYKVNLGT